jgi:hypothetical protein
MVIEEERAGAAFILPNATSRNLLLGEDQGEIMPEWVCLETWSSTPDAKERGRRRRQAAGRRQRG